MSFSGGTFSINTTGQPVVAGTTIAASVFNALTADLATGLSTCMLKDGTQTATAGIGFYAGTVSLPGIYFGTDTATGFYRIGLNNTGFSINGTKLLDLSAGACALTGTLGVSGLFTSTVASGAFITSATATTDEIYGNIQNTTGRLIWGIEGSAGGAVAIGTTAYASVLNAQSNTNMEFATNNNLRVKISGAGVVTIANLAGVGSRAVVVDANGVLSAP